MGPSSIVSCVRGTIEARESDDPWRALQPKYEAIAEVVDIETPGLP
jgi:hypothetical protein